MALKDMQQSTEEQLFVSFITLWKADYKGIYKSERCQLRLSYDDNVACKRYF